MLEPSVRSANRFLNILSAPPLHSTFAARDALGASQSQGHLDSGCCAFSTISHGVMRSVVRNTNGPDAGISTT